MNIPINPFMWAMAALPIVVLILLMLKFQWGATKAAPVGLLITVFTGIVFYKADVMLLLYESGKGVWNALVIVLIVWTAILLYQVGCEAGAFSAIRDGMKRLLPNELLQILAMCWVFESFLQGITGFGVPVAVGAPLLIGIGVAPVWSVILSLLGQAWGNTFGTLAAAWDALAMSAGLAPGSADYLSAALWTAVFLYLWDVLTGFVMCWFYGRGEAVRKGLPAVLILSAVQGGGELLLTQINTTISCFIPSCLALVVLLLLGRMKCYRESWAVADSPIMERAAGADRVSGAAGANPACASGQAGQAQADQSQAGQGRAGSMNLLQAFIPYFSLSALTLVVLLVKPINRFLGQFAFGFSFPETVTGYGVVNPAAECFSPLAPFTHASMFLLVSALIGLVYYGGKGWLGANQVKSAFAKSFSMTAPSAAAVICLVVMSKLMDGTGQTIVLAQGITQVLGNTYMLLTPFVGLLGTFMTGSNMSSNILFGGFQMTTAKLLGVSAPALLGAQSAGGAIGSAISPSKIILGTTTAGILGSEGKVMRKILVLTLPVVIAIGVALFAAVTLAG